MVTHQLTLSQAIANFIHYTVYDLVMVRIEVSQPLTCRVIDAHAKDSLRHCRSRASLLK
jgi:hypothetical protein